MLSDYRALQGLIYGGMVTRGFAPLYPGLSHFTPSGLRNHRPSFSAKAGNPWILKNSAYAKLTLKRVQDLKVQMEELQWGFPIATPLYFKKLITINEKKKWWRLEPGLAKRRALFPEGRGLGVGGRKRKKKQKKAKEKAACTSPKNARR